MAARVVILLVAAQAGGLGGCKQPEAAVDCPVAPVNPPCPDAIPSFAQDIYPNVFAPVCGRCHGPGGEESSKPFTTYQQINGTNGVEAREIYFQVFGACLMPPANAPEQLSDVQRQKLLDWFGCGAPNSP